MRIGGFENGASRTGLGRSCPSVRLATFGKMKLCSNFCPSQSSFHLH